MVSLVGTACGAFLRAAKYGVSDIALGEATTRTSGESRCGVSFSAEGEREMNASNDAQCTGASRTTDIRGGVDCSAGIEGGSTGESEGSRVATVVRVSAAAMSSAAACPSVAATRVSSRTKTLP